MKEDENFLDILNDLSKSRAEKKREDYLKKMKEKKQEKKKNKKKVKEEIEEVQEKIKANEVSDLEKLMKEENIEIEYVEDDTNLGQGFENFKNVFDYFVIPKKKDNYISEDEDEYEEEENNIEVNEENEKFEEDIKLSKKKRKMMSRIKISQLKGLTNVPEVVEAWDVTAQDPVLLVKLKSIKNTVPVPKHWSQKRKFLQNKRGILKPPFKLPDFIEATGISKIRDNSGVDRKSLKQKMRERMQPKLGRMDIDYQVLHDAFFRYQTKPSLTLHGDIYYENKEYENKMKIYKPGRISEKLRVALGILENTPPPWIINMQRYGPPPSYPNLKIPGVNAPLLDPTAEITPNLWTPPVDESKPSLLYDFSKKQKEHWGDLHEVEEDEFSEELEEDVSLADEAEERPNVENLFSGMDTDLSGENLENNIRPNYAMLNEGQAVPNPNAKIIGKLNNLPKDDKSFYTILEQKDTNIKQNEIYGSSFGYVIPGMETDKKEEDVVSQNQIINHPQSQDEASQVQNQNYNQSQSEIQSTSNEIEKIKPNEKVKEKKSNNKKKKNPDFKF
jgi:splicing factor 3B subunit 2